MWAGRPLGQVGLAIKVVFVGKATPELWSCRVCAVAGRDCWFGSLATWGFWRGLCGCLGSPVRLPGWSGLGTVLVSSCGYELARLPDQDSRMGPTVSAAHCLRTWTVHPILWPVQKVRYAGPVLCSSSTVGGAGGWAPVSRVQEGASASPLHSRTVTTVSCLWIVVRASWEGDWSGEWPVFPSSRCHSTDSSFISTPEDWLAEHLISSQHLKHSNSKFFPFLFVQSTEELNIVVLRQPVSLFLTVDKKSDSYMWSYKQPCNMW